MIFRPDQSTDGWIIVDENKRPDLKVIFDGLEEENDYSRCREYFKRLRGEHQYDICENLIHLCQTIRDHIRTFDDRIKNTDFLQLADKNGENT